MQRQRYTPEIRTEALLIFASKGLPAAAAATGVPAGTIASWAHRQGVKGAGAELRAPALEQTKLSIEERKANLAIELLGDVERLRGQLFAPCIEKVVRTRSLGSNMGSEVEIVEVEHDEPSHSDKRALANAMGTLVDKVLQLQGVAVGKEDGMAGPKAQMLAEARDRSLRLVS